MTGRLTPEVAESIIRGWSQDVLDAGRVTLSVQGAAHAQPGRAYVVMTNHTSLLDSPVVFLAMPGPVRMIAKADVAKVPLFGTAMGRMGMVFVDRGDSKRAIDQLESAKARLASGTSVWIAPEGTRTRDGTLGAFKKGGFHLALSLGAPILPAWINGAAGVVPPGTLLATYDQRVTVRFGAPIETSADDDVTALMERVRAALLALT